MTPPEGGVKPPAEEVLPPSGDAGRPPQAPWWVWGIALVVACLLGAEIWSIFTRTA